MQPSRLFQCPGAQQQVFAGGPGGREGTRGEAARGEELKQENPSDGSTHHIMGVLGMGPDSSMCTRGPVLRT